MGIFPKVRGENKKYLSCHHLGTHFYSVKKWGEWIYLTHFVLLHSLMPSKKPSQMTGRGWRKFIIFQFPCELLVLAKHHPKTSSSFLGTCILFKPWPQKRVFPRNHGEEGSRNAVKNGPTWSKWCFWQATNSIPFLVNPKKTSKMDLRKRKNIDLIKQRIFLKTGSNTGSE